MARTNIDIDEAACDAIMRRFDFQTKREAVNYALRTLAAAPLDVASARALRGSGWDGDLDEMRTARTL
jgi:Arc/MetJ family transcription regulator